MGKYKSKLKNNRIRVSRTYKCKYAPFVTTWGGTFLDKEARNHLKIGDSVRLLVESNDFSATRYVTIKKFSSSGYITGVVNDPYYGNIRGGCDICLQLFNWNDKNPVYCCKGYEHNDCNYHECETCHNKIKNTSQQHENIYVSNY